MPKCLLDINGISILENCLKKLKAIEVNEIVIVVGYLKEQIINKIGNHYKGIPIKYIIAKDYKTTNNIVSLYAAKDELNDDVILIESDIFFGDDVLSNIIGDHNIAVVSKTLLPGTAIKGSNGFITEIIPNPGCCKDVYKTVNIYYLKSDFLKILVPYLKNRVESGWFNQEYYETIFANLLPKTTFKYHLTENWAEVDDEEDLTYCRFKFLDIDKKYETISKLHGYYWKYGIVDHYHMYNSYYPPKEFSTHLIDNIDNLIAAYPSGQKELVQLLANYLNINPEYLTISNGASELINIIGRQSKICVSTPTFNEFESYNVIRVPLDQETWQFDKNQFLQTLNESNADLGVIVTPNNPTSLKVAREDIIDILKNTKKNIIVDESFGDFCNQSTFLDSLKEYPNLIVLKSLSKSFGICGLRLGFIASSKFKFRLPIWNINSFAEAFLRRMNKYQNDFKISCQKTKQDIDEFYNRLTKIKNIKSWKPDANFILCKLPTDATSIVKNLLSKNILIKHCNGKTMENANQYIRISCRTPKENDLVCRYLEEILS